MGAPLRVLIVEDSEDDAKLLARLLGTEYQPQYERVDTAEGMSEALGRQEWDIVLADYAMPRFSGPDALKLLKESGLDLPFILVSGVVGEETAVAAMKAGAHDYLRKDNLARLVPAVARELSDAEVRRARARAEEALRESEENFRALADNANDGILMAAGDGFVYANRRAAELTGYTVAELLKLTIKDLMPPDDFEKVIERYRKRLGGEPVASTYEGAHVRKDGRIMPTEVTAAKTVWQGQPADVVFIRDITQRKRAEEALRRSEGQLRLITDNTAAAISYVDSKQRYRFNNKTYEEWFGRSRDEITGRHIREVLGESAYQAILGYVEAALSGEQVSYEEVLPLKDAGARHLSVTYSPYFGQGAVEGFVVLVNDITERKRMEEALRESEAKYRGLVESIHEVIYEVDAGGRITYASPPLEEMGGYSPSEVIGRPLTEFVHPDDVPRVLEGLETTLAGHLEPIEFRLLTRSGEVRWARVSSRPVSEGDRIVGLRGVLTDITQIKTAEEALQQAREALEGKVERKMLQRNPHGLTFREYTVLHLVAAGRTDKEIATELGISPLTAHKHVANLLSKMNARSRAQAGVRAIREGLLD